MSAAAALLARVEHGVKGLVSGGWAMRISSRSARTRA